MAARIGELIEAGRRQPITGQDIAFELQRMVQHFDDFDTPQRMRETRGTLVELREVQMELERERHIERERARRNSPPQARTSPKPPVSAWALPLAERAAVPPAPRPAARIASPRADALALAASPLAIRAAPERGRTVRVLPTREWRTRRPPSGPGEVGARVLAA